MQAGALNLSLLGILVLGTLSCRGTLPPTEPHVSEGTPETLTSDAPKGPLADDRVAPSAAGGSGAGGR